MFDVESLNIAELEELRDACNRRLLQMRRTQGLTLPELLRLFDDVKAALLEQGKEWHSLERWQWMDGEIRFWLNPNDQDIYRTGWFSIDDLIAWTREQGPIMIEEELGDAGEGPWREAGGVPITWLPKGRTDDGVSDRDDVHLRLG